MKTGKKAGYFGPGKSPRDDYRAFNPGSVSGGGAVNRPKPVKAPKRPKRPKRPTSPKF